jgi:galactoside O-acetyltransferase
MPFLSLQELARIGFKTIGKNVYIGRRCVIRNPGNIEIGNDVRIDDFAILSAGDSVPLTIGNYVHIAPGCLIAGGRGIRIGSYSAMSAGVKVYTASDTYDGDYMTNPTMPVHMRRVYGSTMDIGKHSIIGTNSVLLPGASLGEGTAIGANSLVTKPCSDWTIYAGSPVRILRPRNRGAIAFEKELA